MTLRFLAWTRTVSPPICLRQSWISVIAALSLEMYLQDPIVVFSKLLEACVAVRPCSIDSPLKLMPVAPRRNGP